MINYKLMKYCKNKIINFKENIYYIRDIIITLIISL